MRSKTDKRYLPLSHSLKTFIFIFFICNFSVKAQQNVEIELARKYAEHAFKEKDYDFALENYLKLYELDKKDINLNFRIGVCYTETNRNKTGGIPHLEFVTSHNNFPREALFYLGKSYMYNYQFTEAVEALYDFKYYGRDENLLAMTERLIDMAYNAKELINQPQPVRFELLDTTINSTMNDFRPLVTTNEKSLFFTSNRRYLDPPGTYVTDIYYSEASGKNWSKAQMINISTPDYEEIVGISPNGDRLMVYTKGEFKAPKIIMAERRRGKFQYLEDKEIPAELNSTSLEYGACINNEGTLIIFASNRIGGYGGMDLYKIVKIDKHTWSKPINLGSQINSPFDENFPSLSDNGKKLHFSSNGHSSIGGYDLFYSIFNQADSSFQRPINHGFPISTPFDDISISFNANETVAYLASTRNEGIGNLDIYKMYIEKSSKQIIVVGLVMIGTEQNSVPYSTDFLKVYATVYDEQGNLFSRYDLDESGQFFATLYPGKYILDVRFDKAEKGYRENLILKEGDDEEPILKTIYLKQ
ncbi:MAG TPA: hypothetical protein PK990_07745 [Salinivirgaceae bacterium]|nr:hypothetical protein [Salinivirgaceae bacterium]